ncbi:chaperone modulator CbpM [Haloferula rosea]|uniref:MerR family transcriptional regulator n=1 Tax=Haloferula rosea TaxID=490093 RepID=A0A934RDQ2_9BACT|nr:chaperone modulator CbpM [Haloferula rosea]MBK1828685.1 MerR family transcriptional regulator [Haloferula rosea]
MNRPTDPEADLPIYEAEEEAAYSLEIAARLTGVDTETILHFKEEGLIRGKAEAEDEPVLDDEDLRTLRQIQHLQRTCEVNEAGLRLILKLMDELEQLRGHLRSLH